MSNKRANCPSELQTKLARISRKAYSLLRQRSLENNTTMADELDLVLGLCSVSFKPKSIESTGPIYFKPKSIVSRIAHIKLKSIR